MKITRTLVLATLLSCSIPTTANDLEIATSIRNEGLYNSHVMSTVEHLTDTIGARITGSPQMDQANLWTKQKLEQWGLDNAELDPFEFGRGWSFDSITIDMTAPRKASIHGLPMAWTPGTQGDVSGEIIYVDANTAKALEAYRGKVSGKYLMMSESKKIGEPDNKVFTRFDQKSLSKLDQFDLNRNISHHSHGSNKYSRERRLQSHRFKQALNQFLVAEKAAGVLYRSKRQGGIIDASGKNHRVGKTFPVPAIKLAAEHYELLMRLLDNGETPKLTVNIKARFHDKTTKAFNTIAEITGSDKKDEIVMLGGHLDSWHGATGAVDNAAGVAVSMEAVRILKALDLKPRRTIRVALWSGEEQGLVGSRAYVEKHFATRPKPPEADDLPRYMWSTPGWPIKTKPDHQKFSVYFNMDAGSGRFRGIHTEGNLAVKPIFSKWFAPYRDLATGKIVHKDDNYTDHEAFDDVGLPGFQFIQDPLDYFTRLHHTHLDTYDHAIENDLKQASVIMAAFIYNAAMNDRLLPRKPMPKQPSAHQQQRADKEAQKQRRKRQRDAEKVLDI